LIVDDNATNRTLLHHLTFEWRMQTAGVGNAFEALTALWRAASETKPFDIVILDMQMPSMDGLTLARQIKADSAIRDTRMIMLTSLCERLDPTEMRENGIAAFLVKPVKHNQLRRALQSALKTPSSAGPAARRNAPGSSREADGRALKILLAEDNVVNQKVAQKQLRNLGHSVDIVGNGLEALEAVGRIRYDVILMDCQMPEMDGYEATRRLRRRTDGKHNLHVIAMTANAMEGDRENCLACGMDDYVSKPVKLDKLKAALDRAVTKESAIRDVA